MIEHRAVNSCILLLPQANGKAILTVEGVSGPDGEMHPVQQEMVNFHGSQCGFCTPGFVVSMATAHLNGDLNHDDNLAGNLCRCTGYAPIIRAAAAAAAKQPPQWLLEQGAELPEGPIGILGPQVSIPGSIDELADWYLNNPSATIVAGATDVGLWITKQLQSLAPVCFVSQIAEMRKCIEIDGELEIGAVATLSQLHPFMASRHKSLTELIRRFGSLQVRNSATVGGNIANGSPIGDLPPALIALGARINLRQGNSRRQLPLEEFFLGYGVQDLRTGEFLESISVPVQQDRLKCYKLSKRFDQDISAVCGCLNIFVESGRVATARIAFGGMAATPKRAHNTESTLIGNPWNRNTVDRAMAAIETDYSPISDMRASASYRMQAAQNIMLKCFLESNDPSEPASALDIAA